MAGGECESVRLFRDRLGMATGDAPLVFLDFTMIRDENRADLGRDQVHAAAAYGSSSVDDWADRR